ncbi:MAG TPA: ribbon-helix-helix protein, CopG family [Dehalococcoidia bacterium]|jgi:predicted transcriptional regulator|nr:ribbon-helix-helix protein, CopG family [Dehalococcoidia bacterium]
MQKTTIVVPEGLYERIKRLAEERGESMGQLIRESLEDTASRYQPRVRSLGIGDSGRSDISERIDELYKPEL